MVQCKETVKASVADPGCLSQIPYPSFRIPDPDPDPHQIICKFLAQKIVSKLSDQDLDFLPLPYPGSRGQKGTGSRIRSATPMKTRPIFQCKRKKPDVRKPRIARRVTIKPVGRGNCLLYAMLWIRIRRIRMFLALLDPDPLVRGLNPDPFIIKQK
jgi:hypothetical protein